MVSFTKPKIRLKHQKTNDIGLIRADYDGQPLSYKFVMQAITEQLAARKSA